MDEIAVGELVTVADEGPKLDGIVFDTPSRTKVVVAVTDPKRGPCFRSVPPETLTAREQEQPADKGLRMLIRRTPPPTRGASRSEANCGRGRSGHSQGSMHRPTGK